ncbi:MAG TPA: hypothetical protein VKH35_11945, partial [Thermoanaerobaculia bacterium]|nr:hypothetical protein [Thermoanaerobaculia bacterium]
MKPLLTIDGAEMRWPVENAIGRIMIDVPPANRYALSLQGDNVEPLRRDRVHIDAGVTTDFGPLSLRRYPSISGVVIRRQGGDPLPGALIQDANGKLLAKSDDRGVFRFPRKDEGLQSIRVAAVGYATYVVPLGTVTVDRELPPVALGTGVALTIRVHFAEHHGVLPAVKEARLLQISDSGSPPILMAQHEMEERRVVFDGIEPGTYAVELVGMEALEKLVVPVEVDDSKTIDVKID